MASLTAEVKALIGKVTPVVATCGDFGFPNVTPRGSLRVVDDETLVFSERSGGKTYHNLRANPNLSVLLLDEKHQRGYQIKGGVKIITEDELFDIAVAQSRDSGERLPQCVVRINVDEVWSVWPGQTAEPLSS